MRTDLIKDPNFKQWFVDLKARIRQSQIKAAIRVNSELLRLYWDLGHDIANIFINYIRKITKFFTKLAPNLNFSPIIYKRMIITKL
jgi:hypothetical protein